MHLHSLHSYSTFILSSSTLNITHTVLQFILLLPGTQELQYVHWSPAGNFEQKFLSDHAHPGGTANEEYCLLSPNTKVGDVTIERPWGLLLGGFSDDGQK